MGTGILYLDIDSETGRRKMASLCVCMARSAIYSGNAASISRAEEYLNRAAGEDITGRLKPEIMALRGMLGDINCAPRIERVFD